MKEAPIRPFDIRLVPAALVGWVATIIGIRCGSGIVIGFAAVWSVIALLLVCNRGRLGDWSAGSIAMAVIGCCYAGAAAVHMSVFEASPVLESAEHQAWVSAAVVVREDPHRVRSFGPATVSIRAELVQVDLAGVPTRLGGRVLVLAPADGWDMVVPGQSLALRGRLSSADRPDLTLAVIRVHGPPLRLNRPGFFARSASSIRSDLAAAAQDALPPEQAGLLPGLVVGDTSALPEDVETNFRAAGLTHLNAVSGANFSILLGAVLLLTRAVGIGPRTTACICALILVAFVLIARPSPSVLRAAVMGGIGLLALVTGRRRQAVPALCTAVLGLLVWWPQLAVDFGFALSVAATAGLVVLAPVWVDWLRRHGWARGPAEIVAVAGAAHAVTAPIVASMAGTISLVGVAANVAVAPMVAPITVVGASAAVLAPISGTLASLILHLASAPLWWLISVAQWSASVPGAGFAIPNGVTGGVLVLGITVGIVAALRSRASRLVLSVSTVAVVALWIGSLVI